MEEKQDLFEENESLLALLTDVVHLSTLKVPSWILRTIRCNLLLIFNLLIRKCWFDVSLGNSLPCDIFTDHKANINQEANKIRKACAI